MIECIKICLFFILSPERSVTVFSNGTLRIVQLTEKDGGHYLCMFQRPNGEDMELFQVEVLMTPPKIKHLGSAQKRVTYGENVQVDCVASGLPDPEVSWSLPDGTIINNALQSDDSGTRFRRYVMFAEKPSFAMPNIEILPIKQDGTTITWTLPNGLVLDKPQTIGRTTFLSNGTLQLREVATFDRGTYVCQAMNTFGSSTLSYPVAVTVYPPRITNALPSITRVHRGSPVTLNCIAAGIPKPEITWTLPGRTTLVPNNRFTAQGGIHMTVEGSLVIKDPMLMNSGIYKCNAKNPLGRCLNELYLTIIRM
uniref:Ig-like domain-containing protein n=1 Tax=Esox lucius TaxID=8010 RepID=A0A6Q2YW79_ESOLU